MHNFFFLLFLASFLHLAPRFLFGQELENNPLPLPLNIIPPPNEKLEWPPGSFATEYPQFWICLAQEALKKENPKAAIKLLESAELLFPQEAAIKDLLQELRPPPLEKEQVAKKGDSTEIAEAEKQETAKVETSSEETKVNRSEVIAQEEAKIKELEENVSPRILNFIESQTRSKQLTLPELLIKEIAELRRGHHYESAEKLLEEYKSKYGTDYLFEEQSILLDVASGGRRKGPQEALINQIAELRRSHQYTEAKELLEQFKNQYGENYLYEEQNIILTAVYSDEETKKINVPQILINAAADQRRLHNYPTALVLLLEFKRRFGKDLYQYQEESILLGAVSVTDEEKMTCIPANAYDIAEVYTSLGGKPWFYTALEYTCIALKADPYNIDYLFLRATAAQGAAQFIKAELLYREILTMDPCHKDALLNLARVLYGQGRVDESACLYRDYVFLHKDDRIAVLEYARALTSQSRFWDALAVVDCYGKRFGCDPLFWERKARFLAVAGLPTPAYRIVAPYLECKPCDFEALVTYTIAALRLKLLEEALAGYDRLYALEPDRSETTDVAKVLFTPLRSYAFGDFYYYHDNQTLERIEIDSWYALSVCPRTKLLGGGQLFRTRAASFSGLDQRNGKNLATVGYLWGGIEHLFSSRRFLAVRGGVTWTNAEGGKTTPAYDFVTLKPISDRLDLEFNSHYGFYLISPRSLSFHVRRWANQAAMYWRPTLRMRVDAFADFDVLTDGNTRWSVDILPRAITMRKEQFVLEQGFETKWTVFRKELNNGYYSPNFYQRYVTCTYFYYYINDENGLDFTLFLGMEKANRRKPSHYLSATGHLFLGLYQDIYFQLKGKVTSSQSNLGGGNIQFKHFFAAEAEAIINYRF